MGRAIRNMTLVAALVLIAASPARAGDDGSLLEKPRPRQGYYFSLGGFGALSGHDARHLGWLGPWPAVGGQLRTGQAILPWLDIGLDIGVTPSFDKQYLAMLYRLAIEAQFRPIEPLFIRIYGGFGATDVSRRIQGIEKIIGRVGGTYGAAVGWELYPGHDPRRSGGFAVAPYLWFEASPDPGFATLMGGVGIEITWWTGLPKNELVLPDDEAFSKE
jgi:hypothetical protein